MNLTERFKSFLSDRNIQILILTVLLGAFLRLYQIDAESIWWDEAMSVSVLDAPFSNIINSAVSGEYKPPFYFMLLYIVGNVFGSSEIALRFPSAVFGILTIPLIYVVGTHFFRRREGLISALLLSISVHPIYYSQEARTYALLVL